MPAIIKGDMLARELSLDDMVLPETVERVITYELAASARHGRTFRHTLALAGSGGTGKGLALSEPILTPTGFVPLKALQVGDAIVDPEGQPSVITGIYPQGVKQIYKITFSDGTVSRTDGPHLWKARPQRIDFDFGDDQWQVVSTEEMFSDFHTASGDRPRGWAIPLILTAPDLGPEPDGLDFADFADWDRRVPSEFLNTTAAVRSLVLFGLLDNRNSRQTAAGEEFSFTSKQLRDDVAWLARSLGYLASCGDGGSDSHLVRIVWWPALDAGFKAIRSIELDGKEETQCISVSADSKLFVIDNFTVTHNTTLGFAVAKELGVEQVLLVSAAPVRAEVDFIMSNLEDGTMLLLDEIHSYAKQTWLLDLLEGARGLGREVDFFAFGATTNRGQLPQTIMTRFPIRLDIDYTDEELARIADQIASRFGITLSDEDREILMRAAVGNPRTMRNILGFWDSGPHAAVEMAQLTRDGLDASALAMLDYLAEHGKAVGRATLARILEAPGGIADVESVLIRRRYIAPTPAGLSITHAGVKRVKIRNEKGI